MITRWITSVSRRPVSPEERQALRISQFSGPAGALELSTRGLSVRPLPSHRFEAATWVAPRRDVDVCAFFTTPAEICVTPDESHTSDVYVCCVLAGVLQLQTGTTLTELSPGAVGVIRPRPDVFARTRGMLSVIALRLPGDALHECERLSEEQTRLHAAVEAARACLVKQASSQVGFDLDGRLVRELLVVSSEPAKSSAYRERALLMIETEHRNPSLCPETIAARMHISRRHLYRVFAGHPDSVATALLKQRLATAMAMWTARPDRTIEDIAISSGFLSGDQFRRSYRRVHGRSPNEGRPARTTGPQSAAEGPSPRARGRTRSE